MPIRSSHVRSLSIWLAPVVLILIAAVCCRAIVHSSPRGQVDAQGFLFSFYTVLLALSPLVVFNASRTAHRRKEAALELARHGQLAAIGELVDALGDGAQRRYKVYRDAVTRLLPGITAENAYLLDEYRQARLRYIVRPPASPIYSTYLSRLARNSAQCVALKVAIIEALGRVGDSETLTMFDELLDCNPCTTNEMRIREAAARARPELARRVAAEPNRNCLLRPVVLADKHLLVRTASAGANSSRGELLRVGNWPA